MDNQIKIVCPNCKSRLTTAYTPGIEEKLLTCPICRFKAKVALYMQGASAQGGGGASDEATQVNFDTASYMDRTIGSLFIDGKEFALKKGRTVIGRCASTSQAGMQIPTEDRYMSRMHAIITVKDGMSGLEHQLEPANPKNPIKLNGRIVEQGDIVVLNWGDKLTFGHTDVVFEKPRYLEEETQIE